MRRRRAERASERVEITTCENDRYPFPRHPLADSAYGPVGYDEGGPLVIFERMTPRTRYIIMFAYIYYIYTYTVYIYIMWFPALCCGGVFGREAFGGGGHLREHFAGRMSGGAVFDIILYWHSATGETCLHIIRAQ